LAAFLLLSKGIKLFKANINGVEDEKLVVSVDRYCFGGYWYIGFEAK
jgi:hypothetical protein